MPWIAWTLGHSPVYAVRLAGESGTVSGLHSAPYSSQIWISRMVDQSDDRLTRVYHALANPTRRHIVQILKERGKAGFKELHETLKISVAALYHHLDSLEGFVAQGADRKYVLTEDGRAAINAFSTGEERIMANAAQTSTAESRFGFISREVLFGRTVFNYLSQEPLRSLPIAVMIL